MMRNLQYITTLSPKHEDKNQPVCSALFGEEGQPLNLAALTYFPNSELFSGCYHEKSSFNITDFFEFNLLKN